MRNQNVRVYFDFSGNIKHVQENDRKISGEIREMNQSGVDQLKEVLDFVIERGDNDDKPAAKEILNSIGNDISPKSGSRLENMKIRGPRPEESEEFGDTRKPKKKVGQVKTN